MRYPSPVVDHFGDMLAERPTLLADGAIATNLMTAGLAPGEPAELWNTTRPEDVRALHAGFVSAGADILLTNTFGANAARLRGTNAARRVRELNLAGSRLARAAAEGAGRRVLVAGSVGPTGERVASDSGLTPTDATQIFVDQVEALAEGGVDMLWLETFSALPELGAALAAACRTGLPLVATMTFERRGRTRYGDAPAGAAAGFRAFLANAAETRPTAPATSHRTAAFGANCGAGPAMLIESLRELAAAARPGEVLVAKANCGLPEGERRALCYPATPRVMARYARFARDAGARIIGGCCGASPAHVAAMHESLRGYASRPLADAGSVARALCAPIRDLAPGDEPTPGDFNGP